MADFMQQLNALSLGSGNADEQSPGDVVEGIDQYIGNVGQFFQQDASFNSTPSRAQNIPRQQQSNLEYTQAVTSSRRVLSTPIKQVEHLQPVSGVNV